MEDKQQVMVVYAVDRNNTMSLPWIYGVYTDQSEGFQVQETMQNSEEYGHLYWSNNIVLVDKK